jgi:hypothetical protein
MAFAAAVLVLAAASPVAGQVARPQAEAEGVALPAGVTAERLAVGPAEPWPPPEPVILEAHQKAVRKRQVSVEPFVVEAEEWHGIRRYRLRGLLNANVQGC